MARHVYRCPLRWGDMDAFGHVNNVVFLRYLEEARVDLCFRVATQEGAGAFSAGSVVARHEIDYLRPLVHGYEPVTVELWVTRMSAAALVFAYEVKDEEHVYARAATVIAPYDLEAGRPRRMTAEEREFYGRYLDATPATPVVRRSAAVSRGPAAGQAEGAVAV